MVLNASAHDNANDKANDNDNTKYSDNERLQASQVAENRVWATVSIIQRLMVDGEAIVPGSAINHCHGLGPRLGGERCWPRMCAFSPHDVVRKLCQHRCPLCIPPWHAPIQDLRNSHKSYGYVMMMDDDG